MLSGSDGRRQGHPLPFVDCCVQYLSVGFFGETTFIILTPDEKYGGEGECHRNNERDVVRACVVWRTKFNKESLVLFCGMEVVCSSIGDWT